MIFVVPAFGEDKLVRDAFGEFPNVIERDDVVVKWGPNASFSDEEAAALADAFEDAWQVEVVDLGWPTPIGGETWKLNVYIAGTDGNAPTSYGANGYYDLDSDGQPMVVISDAVVPDRALAAEIAAHELNHALQAGAGTYDYTGASAWYWEATAVWMAGVVCPDSPTWPKLLFGWAFRPELPLDHYQRPDGSVEGYHHYGAFIFLRHLSEVEADADLIRRSWVEADVSPLETLDRLLAERGSSLGAAVAAFAARVATWDYEDRDLYRSWLVERAEYYDSHWPAGTLVATGLPASPNTPLGDYGVHFWRLPRVSGKFRLTFDGDPNTQWAVAVSRVDDGRHARATVSGSTEVIDPIAASEAWVTVTALGGDDASRRYQLTLTRVDDVEETPLEDDPGGCDTAAGRLGWRWLAIASVIASRTVCCRTAGYPTRRRWLP
jgi:hypothetical protein